MWNLQRRQRLDDGSGGVNVGVVRIAPAIPGPSDSQVQRLPLVGTKPSQAFDERRGRSCRYRQWVTDSITYRRIRELSNVDIARIYACARSIA